MAIVRRVVSINNLNNPIEAQEKVLRGVNFLCDAVKLTLGPFGKNFLLEKGLKVTNDGITIAKELRLNDEIEDLGLRFAREAAVKTNDVAGDGTTTVLTLLQAILKEIIRLLPGKTFAGKKSVIAVRKQVSEECKDVIEKLKAMVTPIKSKEELIQVARVSVEDEKLAELIGSAQWDLGPDGTLLAEVSNDIEDSVERVSGIRFDNGFGTSLIMNNKEKQRLEASNVQVIMTNFTFQDLNPIKKIIDELLRNNLREIVIVGRAFTQDAINLCMKNFEAGVKLYPINAPYVNQGEIMRDLQAVLGGKFYDQENTSLEDMQLSDIGFAKRVECSRFSAILTGKDDIESKIRITERLKELEDSVKGEESIFQKKAIQARISQLKNGLAIVKVGGLTEADRSYKYDKVEDVVSAVKAALQEGTVPGAGLAFKQIAETMPDTAILKRPLLAPYQQIMINAGENFEVESWVRDPLKVERVALENACSIAATLSTVGGVSANEFPKPLNSLLKGAVSGEDN